jgi:hypothetical protein
MVNTPYSGQVVRAAGAHYDYRPPVPGLAPDHFTGAVEPDIFNPQPSPKDGAPGTVWAEEAASGVHSGYRTLAEVPVTHWWPGQAPVPAGVPRAQAMQTMQERMMVDHSPVNYERDGIRFFQHASEGTVIDWVDGRLPREAGQTLEGPLAGLANGKNGYDQTNEANEVYTGNSANVGRYRVGTKMVVFGRYDNPLGKFGQDAQLRAYTGLTPTLPAEKKQWNEIAAPYTPSSSGANGYWAPAVPWQAPSLFSLPSETIMTDYGVSSADDENTSDFDDGGRL